MKNVNFDQIIDRRGTFCTQWDYIEDRFGEKDLLPFSVSDTDFLVPAEVSEALKKRMDHDIYGYTRWDHLEFKTPITNWYQRRFQADVSPEWVVYSPTVMFSIAKLIEILSLPGDNVLIQTPAYDGFFKIILDNKRSISENPLIYKDGGFHLDFEDLETKLSDVKTKIMLLCSPHNPTGRVWTQSELTEIYRLCQKHNVFLISDEIHMDVVRKEKKQLSVLSLDECPKGMAVCSSASKTFNTAGLVCSYALIPDEDLRKEFLLSLKNKNALSSVSIFGMQATITAYEECEYWVEAFNEYITGNLKFTDDYIKKEIPALAFEVPDATYLAWINTAAVKASSDQLQDALVHHAKVAIMPGNTYGTVGEDFIRLNLGCPREKLEKGLQKLKAGIDFLK